MARPPAPGLACVARGGQIRLMSAPETSNSLSGPSVRTVPEGDDRERLVCPDCGFIQYENPRIVVGSVVTWEERVLLCLREIEPRRGYWTIPAGYLELNETVMEGAAREAYEEARATIEIERLLAVYNIPRISQVQLFFRARLAAPDVAAGPESQEVGLFGWDEIPWDALAFPSVHWALNHFREGEDTGDHTVRTNPPGETGDLRKR
jgi:ADP-ribose pyrophosphatase YjhB (NUDIX family)